MQERNVIHNALQQNWNEWKFHYTFNKSAVFDTSSKSKNIFEVTYTNS